MPREPVRLLRESRPAAGSQTFCMEQDRQGPAALLRRAMSLHRQGRLEEADRDYEAFLRAVSAHAQALRLRGILARERGDLAMSLRLLGEAIRAAPGDPEPACELAVAHMAAGDLVGAEAALRRTLARAPRSVKALANLGALLQYRGHIQESIEWHRRALACAPGDAEVRCNLAKALVEAGRADEALAECDTALALDPGDPQVLAARGAVLCDLGRFGEAVHALEQALLRRPGDEMSLVNLAFARHGQGQLAPALDALRTAVAVNPDNARATADLAQALLHTGEDAESLAICERFLARHPGERMVLAAYGHALRDAGREAESRALLDHARLVRVEDLASAPAGFDSLRAFNQALARLMQADRSRLPSPPSKATRGGSQTGELDLDCDVALRAWCELVNTALRSAAAEWRAAGFASHPVMACATQRWTLRAWGTLLTAGGVQEPHIHPLGWLSGVYYVQVPADMGDGESGWLEFGTPPERYSRRSKPELRRVEPREGRLVIFPSYFHHRTLPFGCPGTRISMAFDAMPRFA